MVTIAIGLARREVSYQGESVHWHQPDNLLSEMVTELPYHQPRQKDNLLFEMDTELPSVS